MTSTLPYGAHWIEGDDIVAVTDALRRVKITQGPLVDQFEHALADFVGCQGVSAVSSGTAALHLAYAALDLGPGDEIITSPITFVATANAARMLGADVLFSDVEPDTGNMNPESVEQLITPNTKGIVPVHFGGLPVDLEPLRKIADQHGLWIVEDAAHAFAAEYRGTKTGSCYFSEATVFSFHPVKHLTTGEGGCVCTNDESLKSKVDQLREHGILRQSDDESPWDPWYYEMRELGWNYRISDLQCALGLSQLKKQPRWIDRRRELVSRYDQQLRTKLGDVVSSQGTRSDRVSSYHLFSALFDFEAFGLSRAELMLSLREEGIQTQVHYIPVYHQPYYKELYGNLKRVGAESFYGSELSLPLFPAMDNKDVDRVVRAIESKRQVKKVVSF